jgi:hypothetical protein
LPDFVKLFQNFIDIYLQEPYRMKPIIIFSICCFSINSVAQKVSLALSLKQDSTYYLTTNVNSTITQTINGAQQLSSVLISGRVAHKVTAIKDTVYEMEVTYKNLAMNMNIAGKVIRFDSNSDDQSPFARIMRGMLDKSFSMIITKSGHVLAVNHTDNIFANLFNGIEGVSEAQKTQITDQMKNSYGEKSIKSNFQEAFPMFPAGAISPSDQWLATSTIEANGVIIINTIYHLQTANVNYNLIHGDALLKSEGSAQYHLSNGIPMRFVKITGSVTSDLKLDKNTGWVIEAKTNRFVKGTIEVQNGPKTPGGLSVPMSVGSNTTLSGN